MSYIYIYDISSLRVKLPEITCCFVSNIRFYFYILIFLCEEYVYLMVLFVGICRVFILSFFHIKHIITIRTRRNFILVDIPGPVPTVALLSSHFVCMYFCLLQ